MNINTLKSRIDFVQKKINDEDRKYWQNSRKLYEGTNKREKGLHSVNFIWSTIRTMLPELMFSTPKYKLKALKPGMNELMRRKNEALLNQIIAQKKMSFSEVIKSVILAAHIDMGVVTWGCNSKFEKNPMAGQPITYDNGEPIIDNNTGLPLIQPNKIAIEDSYYIKRVRATDFYPDPWGGEIFQQLGWYAVAEIMTKKQVSKIYGVSTKKLTGSIAIDTLDDDLKNKIRELEEMTEEDANEEDFIRLRILKLYDRVEDKVFTFCMEYDKMLDEEPMPATEPVAVLKFNDRLDEFYPISEINQVEDLQYEIEVASTMRSEHMKRSAKKVGIRKGSIKDKSKLESAQSHVVVEVEQPTDIFPIDFGTCDAAIYNHEAICTEQFNQVIGVSSSARGGAASKRTATAEIIQDRRLNTRQRDKIMIIAKFLSEVGNGLKNCIDETLTRPMEVEIIGQDQSPMVVDYIPTIDISSDFDCSVEIADFSAPNEELDKAQWVALLDIFSKAPIAFADPTITRETLKRFGIDNKELENAFLQLAQMNMAQQAIGAGGKGGGSGRGLPPANLGAEMGALIGGGMQGGG